MVGAAEPIIDRFGPVKCPCGLDNASTCLVLFRLGSGDRVGSTNRTV